MRKLVLVIIGIVFTLSVKGQENKLSIGLINSLDIYSFSQPQPIDPATPTVPQPLKRLGLNGNYSYSLGIRFQYDMTEKLSLRSGLLYSKRKHHIDYDFIFIDPLDPLIPKETNVLVSYLSIPLMIGYELINKGKFKLVSSAGIINEILIRKNEKSVFEDNSIRESEFQTQNLKPILISTQANLGFEYHLTEKVFLTVEPYLRFRVNYANYQTHVYKRVSYGGNLSFNYKFSIK